MTAIGDGRRERLGRSRLYVVTGARAERGDLAAFLEEILEAGVDIVQLREKEAEAGDLLLWSPVFRDATRRHDALFVVNDRPGVALAAGADGVHLGQNDLSSGFVRALVGPDMLIGLSTHSPRELVAAAPEADYVCAGPVFETPTKGGRPATGLSLIEAAAERERRPWFAIGGLNVDTLPPVMKSGARRIVVVRAVTEASDPGASVRALLEALA